MSTKTDELMRLVDEHAAAYAEWVVHGRSPADQTRAAILSVIQEVVSGWRPIETAPKDGSTILIWTESPATGARRVHQVWWCRPYEAAADDRCWWESAKLGARSSPVVPDFARGWQPLPEPPEAS